MRRSKCSRNWVSRLKELDRNPVAATAKFIPIPIPPLTEQRCIVAKVDQLMILVDALETQLASSRTTAAKLLDAIVAELTAA